MLNIVCVKWGTLYGPEYVNILHDMVRRNLSDKIEGRFVCFTDDASGLDDGIEVRELPSSLTGWWNKLYLFKDGVFEAGDRIVFFDLDTVITGGLDDIVKYDGEFAILRDFYRPDGYGSAVMAWEAGKQGRIWDEYEAAGYPSIDGGDQAWIEQMVSNADRWQDLLPRQFASYKVSCRDGIPKHCRVVCFHGLPRPHEVDGWVPKIWRIGGGSCLEFEIAGNTGLDAIEANIRDCLVRGLPVLDSPVEPHERHAVLIGGGPSINEFVDDLCMRQSHGQTFVTLNNSWTWLQKHGLHFDMQVMLDARWENAGFVPQEGGKLWYASQCHPDVFTAATGRDVTVWHANIEELHSRFDDLGMFWVGSGTTVGLRAILLLYVLGYRKFHVYGYDSSYSDGGGHAYPQGLNDGERVIEVECSGRKFMAAPWMVTQTNEFLELASYLTAEGCEITVHGDGLLQHAVKTMLVSVDELPEIVEIDGLRWPAGDQICRPSMAATVGDVAEYLKHTNGRAVAVQAGGNVGVFPKALAAHFDVVHSFEPDGLNAECFRLNCTEPNIVLHEAAVGDVAGFIGIARAPANCGANYIEGSGDIPIVTIDSFKLQACDLIQLDVEGFELSALKGARQTIRQFRPTIVIEENGLGDRYGVKDGTIEQWLKPLGYSIAARIHRDIIFTATN